MKPVTYHHTDKEGHIVKREKRLVDPDGSIKATFEIFSNTDPEFMVFIELNLGDDGKYVFKIGSPLEIRDHVLENQSTIRDDVSEWLLGKVNAVLMDLD